MSPGLRKVWIALYIVWLWGAIFLSFAMGNTGTGNGSGWQDIDCRLVIWLLSVILRFFQTLLGYIGYFKTCFANGGPISWLDDIHHLLLCKIGILSHQHVGRIPCSAMSGKFFLYFQWHTQSTNWKVADYCDNSNLEARWPYFQFFPKYLCSKNCR